jgi:NADH dehydrogenase
VTGARETTKLPHVLILGGGFAGLYAAKDLRNAPVQVTVVDRRNHHLFQPMLYQVATAGLNPSDIASPIRSILRASKNTVVLLAFERAERETDPVRRHAYLTFVIVGGGPTGVEMAGAVAEIRRYALRRDFRHIDPGEATVMLLEGGPRLLPSYPEKLSAQAKQKLRHLGVEVRTETLVTDIRPGSVNAAGWVIPTQTVIWAAGNTASPILGSLGAPLDRVGRAIVEPDCTIPGHPEVFVLGDAAAFNHQEGGTLPGICPVAIQMGEYTASVIEGDLAGRPRRAFSYWDKGCVLYTSPSPRD